MDFVAPAPPAGSRTGCDDRRDDGHCLFRDERGEVWDDAWGMGFERRESEHAVDVGMRPSSRSRSRWGVWFCTGVGC
jgi:hypothetical protein